jgi:hypothetical protein
MIARFDIAGSALLALAAFGLYHTQGQREASAASYAEAARYNRALTGFVAQHRERLAGRQVALFGLTGLSPWSHTTGAYLARRVGAAAAWRVHVPHADLFYSLDTRADSSITVRTESACEDDAQTVVIVFDERGEGSFAGDCRDALARAHPVPSVERWWPERVSQSMAAAGFHVTLTGERLGSAVTVAVDGRALPVVRARGGRLITTTTPPLAEPGRTVAFDVLHRGRSVVRAEIEVTPDR